MELRIISCERPVFSSAVLAVYAKSPVGWFGILPRHAPAAFLLKDAPLRAVLPHGEKRFRVKTGVLYVRKEGVTVVADEVEGV
ncbi:MAG: F0F1 ATP synthase subunit epsilon [Candidatus Bipolaricaulaceae bacterium]